MKTTALAGTLEGADTQDPPRESRQRHVGLILPLVIAGGHHQDRLLLVSLISASISSTTTAAMPRLQESTNEDVMHRPR